MLRSLAKQRLPWPVFDYIDGAADDELTKARNTAAFANCDLVPDVLAGVAEARAVGTWERLKACSLSSCQWAFYDRSKNRSGRWCSMQTCGNRTKTRSYRSRRRGEG